LNKYLFEVLNICGGKSQSESVCVMQEYDNESEQAVCDVAVHYTDTPLDIGKSSRLGGS